MQKQFHNKLLRGTVTVPPSKSQAHRAVIAACLAEGTSEIKNLCFSQDIRATVSAMKALGSAISEKEDSLSASGSYPKPEEGALIDCCESGSTLRFLIPLALLSGKTVSFTGRGRLLSRPLDPYFTLFETMGIKATKTEQMLTFSGKLTGGDFELPGNVSSQFVTGLLFALPLCEKDSRLRLTTTVESVGYIQMTLDILATFGIHIEHENYQSYFIPGGQHYTPADITIEGDYSQAAFFLCANALGSDICVKGLSPHSSQGDKAILDIIASFGKPLCATTIDASQIPDLVPVLAVLATQAQGETKIINAARLRMKESDRLSTTKDMLSRFGASVTETEDSLIICGKANLKGATIETFNDHRIAMAAAIAATVAEGETCILGAECVAKSYGNFWQDFKSLQA